MADHSQIRRARGRPRDWHDKTDQNSQIPLMPIACLLRRGLATATLSFDMIVFGVPNSSNNLNLVYTKGYFS